MKKIVINNRHGGFCVSLEATQFMAERGNRRAMAEIDSYTGGVFHGFGRSLDDESYDREDPDLIAAVEALGEKANGMSSSLKIVEIPDDVEWVIEECGGWEWVAEKHRVWS